MEVDSGYTASTSQDPVLHRKHPSTRYRHRCGENSVTSARSHLCSNTRNMVSPSVPQPRDIEKVNPGPILLPFCSSHQTCASAPKPVAQVRHSKTCTCSEDDQFWCMQQNWDPPLLPNPHSALRFPSPRTGGANSKTPSAVLPGLQFPSSHSAVLPVSGTGEAGHGPLKNAPTNMLSCPCASHLARTITPD